MKWSLLTGVLVALLAGCGDAPDAIERVQDDAGEHVDAAPDRIAAKPDVGAPTCDPSPSCCIDGGLGVMCCHSCWGS